jgi:DnaJ domain
MPELLLLGGFAILCGLLLLGYLFVNADPARLARVLKWTGIVLAVLAVIALVVFHAARLAALLAPLAAFAPLLRRLRSMWGGFRGPRPGTSSDIATAYLRMRLDHDTGAMTGTVLRGRFIGMRLDELGAAELLALLRECRADDEDGARLLEAYLDRAHPEWRDEMAGERASGTGSRAQAASADITVEEAWAILGLSPGADAEAIKAAHHRLMKQLHPDHGGTDYLATKINRARDVLLGRQT